MGVIDSAARMTEDCRPFRLYIASMMYHPVYAGPSVRFKRYLPGFCARGAEVRVLTATPDRVKAAASGMPVSWAGLENRTLLPEEYVDGVPVQRIRVPDEPGNLRDLHFSLAAADFIRRTSSWPDIVQVFSTRLHSLPVLWRLRRLDIPVVATWTIMPRLSKVTVSRAIERAGTRWDSRLVDCLVVSSDVMRAAARNFGIRTRIEVIPHGVDVQRFRPPVSDAERTSIRVKLGIPADAPLLLFVGPITPRKRVDLLLEAWCRLARAHPELHLAVVGPRLDLARPALAEFSHTLHALAEQAGAPDRLHFPGLVENVEEYMRAATIFAFTSSREGFPNVVAEALASGLPVVTTPFVGLPREFGVPGRHYVLTGFDPDQLAEDLSQLLVSERQRKELGDRARTWVQANLNIDRTIDQYIQLYRDVAFSGRLTRNRSSK